MNVVKVSSTCTPLTIQFAAELEEQRLQNAELRKRLEDVMQSNGGLGQEAGTKSIPRPKGTAGTNFSIQEAMGLSGSTKKYETYKAIQVRMRCECHAAIGELVTLTQMPRSQRNLRDLAMNARINWEVPWAQVPARDKAKLFEVVSAVPCNTFAR